MAQSGNRPPRRSQSAEGGSRPPGDPDSASGDEEDESAVERVREKLAQPNMSSSNSQAASKQARSVAPASARTKVQSATAQPARTDGPVSRRTAGEAQRRSTAMTMAILGTVLVVLAILVIVLVSVTGGKSATTAVTSFGMRTAPTSVVDAISNVPASAFTAAGSTADSTNGPFVSSIPSIKPSQPLLKLAGKPLIVYVGSNWCPFCAATRWPLTVALARFGKFKGLRITASGKGAEPYPGTSTLSFYHTTYSSPYIAFTATELCTDLVSSSTSTAVEDCNGYKPLQTLSGTSAKIFQKYDYPPFQTSSVEGGIPFIDVGDKYLGDGAMINPVVLAGYSQVRIAQSLANNPAASPARTILAGANYYTATICELTHGKPRSVCNMPVVKQAARSLEP